MDSSRIRSLFTLFSGEEYGEKMVGFVGMAIIETVNMLREGANKNDERLDFLAAAIANYRWQMAMSIRDSREYSYSGSAGGRAKTSSAELSMRLLNDYCILCDDLIKPQDFVFSAFSKEDVPDE